MTFRQWALQLRGSGSNSDNGQQLIPAGPREPAGQGASHDASQGHPPPGQSQDPSHQALPSTSASPPSLQPEEKSLFKKQRDLIRKHWALFPTRRSSVLMSGGRKLRVTQASAFEMVAVQGPRSKDRALWPKVDPIKSSSWPLPSQGATTRDISTITGGGFSLVSSSSENEAGKSVRDQIKHRILQLSEQLRVEQTNQEENIIEFRQLSYKAKRRQEAQVWEVFEKRYNNTSATIAQLQKHLHSYQRKLLELENQSQFDKHLSNLQINIESRAGSLSVLNESGVPSSSKQDIPAGILNSRLSASASTLLLETTTSHSDLTMGGYAMSADKEDSGEDVQSLESNKPAEESFSSSAILDQLSAIKSAQANLETECKSLKDKYHLEHKLILDSLKEEKRR